MSTDTQSSVPQNSIDLESKEASDLFKSAYNEAAGQKPDEPIVADTPSEPVQADPVTPIEPVAATTPEPVATTTDTPAAPSAEDDSNLPAWAKGLSDATRTEIEKLIQDRQYHEQKWRSDIGRQSALQRQLANARSEAQAVKNRLAQYQQQVAAGADQSKTLEDWNKLIEADPGLAKAIELRLQHERATIQAEILGQLDATVSPLVQHSEDNYIAQQHQLLAERVPNYQEVVSSPVYDYWINNVAPPFVRQTATTSTSVDDAIAVLQMYASQAQPTYDYMVNIGMLESPPQMTQQQHAVQAQTPVMDTSRADKVAQSRQQKVQSAPVVTHSNPIAAVTSGHSVGGRPGDSVDLDSPTVQALFADAYNKLRRRS